MADSHRTRWFAVLGRICMRRPSLVLGLAGLIVVVAALGIPGLRVTTSRYGLVAPDNPYQARLLAFFDRFGYPDSPVVVVAGGTPEMRRRVVDDLVERLEGEPELRGRVLARVDPEQIAELLLLSYPNALTNARALLSADGDLKGFLEGGLATGVKTLNRQLNLAVVADQLQLISPLTPPSTRSRTDDAITWMAATARTLEAMLSGENGWGYVMSAIGDIGSVSADGVDQAGYLVGRKNEHHLIAILADLPGDEVSQLRPVVDRIRALRDESLAAVGAPGVTARVTGLPALAVDEQDVITIGLFQSSIATALGILILFLFIFRSLRQTVVALLPLFAGVVLTIATARVLFGELNLITSGFIAILLGLGIDFAVHALARYNEYLRGGASPEDAVPETLHHTGPGILTGAVTTAVAFLTTATTEFTAFAQLGVLTAAGLLYVLLGTFFLLPPLLLWGSRTRTPVAPELYGARHVAWAIRAGPRTVVAVAVLLAIGSGALLGRLSFNVRYFDFLPAKTESAMALARLEEDGAMSPTFATVSAESIEEARTMAERLRSMDTVAAVHTPSDLMPPLSDERLNALRSGLAAVKEEPNFRLLEQRAPPAADLVVDLDATLVSLDRLGTLRRLSGRPTDAVEDARAAVLALRARIASLPGDGSETLRAVNARIAGLMRRAWETAARVSRRGEWRPADLPTLFQARFASHDRSAVALYVYPSVSMWDRDASLRFRQDVESVDKEAAGPAISLHEHAAMILSGFERAALVAAVLILLVLLADFRSLRDALLALIPIVCGWLWMLGTMSAAGQRFDFANIVALPLVLGIGIDAGVHLIHRCRESAEANEGVARIEDVLRGTGAAVFVAALTTMIGFAGLMAADYGAMVSLGSVMILGIGCCLLAALFVLPAVLMLLGRAR